MKACCIAPSGPRRKIPTTFDATFENVRKNTDGARMKSVEVGEP